MNVDELKQQIDDPGAFGMEPYLKQLIALAKAEHIVRLKVAGVEIEFAPDAFRPAAPARPELTEDERKRLEKRAEERRLYGSSRG